MVRIVLSLLSLFSIIGISVIADYAHAQDKPVVAVRNPIKGAQAKDYLENIKLPKGFSIEIYTEGVVGARSMALGDKGTVFVGTRGLRADPNRKGPVYAVVDSDSDYKADTVHVIAEGLYMPNGVAFRDGSLYVAEPNKVTRYDNIEENLKSPQKPVLINDSFPSEAHHGWKYIGFGPDGKLYLPVGAPCNICESSDDYAVINRINADGTDKEIVAKGVRNTVGFDWHPETGQLWFTDNGRDLWEDDLPPDELNVVEKDGQHFGFPYEYGKSLRDGEFDIPKNVEFTGSALELAAHTAPLGMTFYRGDMFPEKYKNQILIPHHGSWNRSKAAGHYINLVSLVDGKPQAPELFASGWLLEEGDWGRPVDILELPDGSILVSDDQAGVIYRISYSEEDQ